MRGPKTLARPSSLRLSLTPVGVHTPFERIDAPLEVRAQQHTVQRFRVRRGPRPDFVEDLMQMAEPFRRECRIFVGREQPTQGFGVPPHLGVDLVHGQRHLVQNTAVVGDTDKRLAALEQAIAALTMHVTMSLDTYLVELAKISYQIEHLEASLKAQTPSTLAGRLGLVLYGK